MPRQARGGPQCGHQHAPMRSSTETDEAHEQRAAGIACALSACHAGGDTVRRPVVAASIEARQGAFGAPTRAARRKRNTAPGRRAGVGAWCKRRRTHRGGSFDRAHQRTRTSAARHLRYRDLGWHRPSAASPGGDPPVHSARRAGLRDALSRPLASKPRAVHRIRSLAEPDHGELAARNSADPDQRSAVGALL